MSDDEIFVILEKCKGDLEYATLENAVQGLVPFFTDVREILVRVCPGR